VPPAGARRGAVDGIAPRRRLSAWAAAVSLQRVWRGMALLARTCVLCGPPLASALCALHPIERRDRCPCRRRPATADAGGGFGLPGIACPSSTAVEPAAQVRLRTPLLSLAGQEAFGRATADQRQDARLVTSVARYRSVLSAQARRPWSEEDARVGGCPSAVPSAAVAPRTRWPALTGRDGVRRGARKAVPCTDAASSRTRSAAEGHASSRWCAAPHRAPCMQCAVLTS
jgi:hypothetical protein